MWLPPYFGDYAHLVTELLKNPFLGSGQGGIVPRHADTLFGERHSAFNPQPVPWLVPFLISALATREAAGAMTNKAAAQQATASAESAISWFLDDYCSRPFPWPFPGPPPW